MTPLVSIIMPCYNAERFIAQSIESVMAQTFASWELLITDDCSADNSVAVVKKYCAKDKRINLLESKEHHGIAVTRNMSIQRAKGRFIAFLDSDDIWKSDKLERQIGFMFEHDVAFRFSGAQYG